MDSKTTKKENFIRAFELSACNISIACRKTNIVRQTYYNWIKEDKEFAQKVDDARESLLDLAESMLQKKIAEGSTTEIIFYLKTVGKKRGYVERQELAGVDQKPIVWKETKTYVASDDQHNTDNI